MEKLKEMTEQAGLYVQDTNGQLKGNSCNVLSWPTFRLWINKSGHLTVKTRGIQKSFESWDQETDFIKILRGFEIL